MHCKNKFIVAGLLCFLMFLPGCQWRSETIAPAEPPAATQAPTPAPTPTPQPTPTPTPAPVEIAGVSVNWDARELDLSADGEDSSVSMEEVAVALRQLPQMETVDLRGQELSNEEKLALDGEFPTLNFLWEVDVLGVTVSSEDEYIILDKIPMTDTTELERVLPLLGAVKKIDMCRCGLDDETMYELNQRYEDIEFVWITYIGNSPQRTDITGFCSNTVGMIVHATDEKLMTQLKYFPKLKALDLGHSEYAIRDISWLKWVPDLEVLILVGCGIGDLTPIAQLKELSYLEVFTNAFVVDISPLAQCPKLQDLNLSVTSVNDLTPLHGMPSLRRLWVNNCKDLSVEQVDAFWRATPNCGISYSYRHSGARNGWRQDDRYYWMRDMFNAHYMPLEGEVRTNYAPEWYTPEGEEPRPMPTPTPRQWPPV